MDLSCFAIVVQPGIILDPTAGFVSGFLSRRASRILNYGSIGLDLPAGIRARREEVGQGDPRWRGLFRRCLLLGLLSSLFLRSVCRGGLRRQRLGGNTGLIVAILVVTASVSQAAIPIPGQMGTTRLSAGAVWLD